MPVILADRGFARAPFLEWLQSQHLDYDVRVNRGTCLTDGQDYRCKLGEDGLLPEQQRWLPAVRFGLYHDRPRALTLNMALSWRLPRHLARSLRHKTPDEPWYLATSLTTLQQAVAWYQQRWWIENHLHWRRDVTLREDHCQVRKGAAPQVLAALNSLVLAVFDFLRIQNVAKQMRLGIQQPHRAVRLCSVPC